MGVTLEGPAPVSQWIPLPREGMCSVASPLLALWREVWSQGREQEKGGDRKRAPLGTSGRAETCSSSQALRASGNQGWGDRPV